MQQHQHPARFAKFVLFLCVLLQCLPISGSASARSLALLDIEFLFNEQETRLSSDALQSLDLFTKRLLRLKGVLSVRIVGHTSNNGDPDTNYRISKERANYIKAHLKSYFPTATFVSLGAGSSIPVADNALLKGRARNQRVEVQVIGSGSPVATR